MTKNKKHNIPIFIVNLKKDIVKRESMEQQCRTLSLHCRFINAVDGAILEEDLILQKYSPIKAQVHIGRELSKGEIGCAFSHLSIYRQMIEENIDKAVVFEDDIKIQPVFLKILEQIDILPKNWECILFGYHRGGIDGKEATASLKWRKELVAHHKLVRLGMLGYGTYAYIINLKGAKKILQKSETLIMPIDHYTGNDSIVNLYAISPPCVRIPEEYMHVSDLSTQRIFSRLEAQKKRPLWKKVLIALRLKKMILRVKDMINVFFALVKPLKRYQ